ncbi:MAG: NADH-dependent alcohol dehydrogenase, partial [Ruminococcus sp.]
ASEGLAEMEKYMREIGLVMNISDLGVTEAMIEGIADSTLIMTGGYKVLTRDEVIAVLRESL